MSCFGSLNVDISGTMRYQETVNGVHSCFLCTFIRENKNFHFISTLKEQIFSICSPFCTKIEPCWSNNDHYLKNNKLDTCKSQKSAASLISSLVLILCRIAPSVYLKQTNTLDIFGRFITGISIELIR